MLILLTLQTRAACFAPKANGAIAATRRKRALRVEDNAINRVKLCFIAWNIRVVGIRATVTPESKLFAVVSG